MSLVKEEIVDDVCYRKLTFANSDKSPIQMTVFLSPDFMHFSHDLNDTRVDAQEKENAEAKVRSHAMKVGTFASWGQPNAPITVVIFSDFQCPYCRKVAGVARQLIDEKDPDVQIVFRNFPLPMHPWAQIAAESAECVRLQSNADFWVIHDFIFQNQDQLAPDTIRSRLEQEIKKVGGVDFSAYQSCVEKHSSSEVIRQDLSLGDSIGVNATPTIYANGFRLSGTPREQLLTFINQLKRQTAHSVE